MTSPSPYQTPDTPIVTVNKGFGPTEIAHYLVIIGGLLGSSGLHSDLGLTKHASDYAPLVFLGGLISLMIYRLVKHRGAMKWNTTAYVAQLQHVASVVINSGGGPMALKAGVSALTGAFQTDLAPTTMPPTTMPTPVVVPVPAFVSNVPDVPDVPAVPDVPVPDVVVDAQPGDAVLPPDTNPLPPILDHAALVQAGWTPPTSDVVPSS